MNGKNKLEIRFNNLVLVWFGLSMLYIFIGCIRRRSDIECWVLFLHYSLSSTTTNQGETMNITVTYKRTIQAHPYEPLTFEPQYPMCLWLTLMPFRPKSQSVRQSWKRPLTILS